MHGMDLFIENAGELSDAVICEMVEQVRFPKEDRYILLLDNPLRISSLKERQSKFEYAIEDEEKDVSPYTDVKSEISQEHKVSEESDSAPDNTSHDVESITIEPINSKVIINYKDDEDMDVDAFVAYASEYAKKIDCIIPGKDMLALYEKAELMQADGLALTKQAAGELIEQAADKAEQASFLRRIFKIGAKYNKDGLLILKEEHIMS